MMPLRTLGDGERQPRKACKVGNNSCSISRLLVGVILIACIVLVAVTFDAAKAEALLVWVQENKQQGSVLFLALYTAGVILMLPAMVMAMASGAIFGLVFGAILAWLGSAIGQVIAFLIGRYLLRAIVLDYLSRQFPKWTAIDRAMETEGWKLVTLLRLSPIAPWNVLNYGLSVTSIPLFSYAVASALAILPYLVLFVYFGSLARNLADIFTGNAGLDTNTTIVMGVISGVVMVAIVWYTTHFSRKAISQALMSHDVPAELHDADVVELLGGEEPTEITVEMTELVNDGNSPNTLGTNGISTSVGSLSHIQKTNSSSLPASPSYHDLPQSTSHSYLHPGGQTVSPRGRGITSSGSERGEEQQMQLLVSRLEKKQQRGGVLDEASGGGLHTRSGHSTPTRSHSPYARRTNPVFG